MQPMLGRDFVDADAAKGAAKVVLLSYEGWQAFFGGDPKVIGQTLRVGGDPTTVIGVLPPGMHFPQIAMGPKLASGAPLAEMIYSPFTPSDWDLKQDTGNFNYRVTESGSRTVRLWWRRMLNWRPCRMHTRRFC